ncbi:FAD-dependent oxidoreductase [Pseudooceanicola sp. CBS1P-1]|uniref:FAD-dependent oxidoreductase n=1 Tax=Pseudooceanicola albus TaxID=2692189 RepID=A0A6L7G616_9RHOB|nr:MULTISPECIES: FAD-dependent oxidoreductase [Pseudooceanicola]MBT9385663.1 FAD-dependent oxidoreductase [Pseudooceanicola endophyticus]MXN18928.1 FAD-dependent oxidoreductase [Pseudooceanicola albus]
MSAAPGTDAGIDARPVDGAVYDLIIVGSGAGGLATAVTAAHLGLNVAVLEKAPVLGGTTAWSGGWLWVPRNPLATEAGIEEPAEAPMTYLRALMGNRAGDPQIRRYLETGPEMIRFFRDHTALAFVDGNRVPDFNDLPGAAPGGRSVCAAPFDGRRLGPWIDRLRPPLDIISLAGMGIASGADMKHFFAALRRPGSTLYVARRLARHGWDLLRHRRSMQLVNGNALVAALMRSALDRGVALFADAPVTALRQEGGAITGVTLASGATLSARRGVVLATGGFPHDPGLQRRLFAPEAGPLHHSAAPRDNSGDGLRLAEALGAQIRDDLSDAAAWAPVSRVPDGRGGWQNFPHLIDRAKPGIIAVRGRGERFTNEADSYHRFMRALFAATPDGVAPEAWLIADHRAQRRWGLGWARPAPFPLGRYRRNGYLKSGRTLRALAHACNLDPATLEATVARFNAAALAGEDPDFGRGASAYNRVQGDADHRPNPALGALTQGPFHAVRILPGSLGTFAGLDADEYARVRDGAGRPIPGLFAAGNDLSSIFAGQYPSGGITLGPAMTFGYIAARVAAGQLAPATDTPTTDTAKTESPVYGDPHAAF